MIVFVRHGETDTNVAIENGLSSGEDDAALNQNGFCQARATAELLRSYDFDIIISSPLKRAVQTAELINEYHGAKMILENDLQERMCGFVGTDIWNRLFDYDDAIEIPGVEKLDDFVHRVSVVIEKIKVFQGDNNVLVVAHGGVNHAFYAYFNHLPRRGSIRIDMMHNADFRIYEFKEKTTK